MASLRKNAVLPLGSKILITGVNGYIGSHVADQALAFGYDVRGCVRNVEKHRWLETYYADKHGAGRFELVEVPDMTVEGAYKEAVQGVSGVIHMASIVTFNPDAKIVIPTVVNSTLGILKEAASAPGVKRFVLTSSATAAAQPDRNDTSVITNDSYNEVAVALADNLPEGLSDISKGFLVYGSSKVKGEQALWKWTKENKPDMVVNTVLPGGCFGTIISVKNQGHPSTSELAHDLYTNNQESIKLFIKDYPPEWYIDVQDVARLHIAALVHPDVKNERVFGYTSPYNWNIVLGELRALYPDKTFMDNVDGIWDDLTVCPGRERAESLLREMGQERFSTLRESLARQVESESA